MPLKNRTKHRAYCKRHYGANKPTYIARNKRRYDNTDPAMRANAARRHKLKHRYGITDAEYQKQLSRQDYKCAACHSSSPNHINGWNIDHDHRTGHMRGILCFGCNVALGAAADSQPRLRALADYLESALCK